MALVAKLAATERPVISVNGIGGCMFNFQELEAPFQYKKSVFDLVLYSSW